MPRSVIAALMAGLVLGAAAPAWAQPAAQGERPNILVILADDVGFSDFGAYGGEARTPTIDRLARTGAQFSRYYTSPLCAPSRAMLLTGLDNHRTGLATIPEVLPPEHEGQPGYSMRLEPGAVTIARRLREAGYRTYMTGKWHLGHGDGDLPVDHGFDHSFILDASGADNWRDAPYMPYYDRAPWFEDRARAALPEDFYSSQFLVDQMIRYLDADKARSEPFFAYVAFQAVHIPVQAPGQFTRRYESVYDAGWEVVREARAERVRALGLVPANAPLPPPHPRLRAWEALTPDDQALYARSMAVHAGMLEAMDFHIGRLLAYLAGRGYGENTLVLIASDNGPEPSNPYNERGLQEWMALQGYTRRLEDLGEDRSYVFIGPEWANATASPNGLFKFYASEGGLHVPFVMAGPGVRAGRIDARAFVTDIAPTLLDFAGAPAAFEGALPMNGRSLRPLLAGETQRVYGPDDAVGIEVSGNAALYRGDYKLVRNMPPWGDGAWRLYNLALDPNETRDLAADEPATLAAMQAAYEDYAAANGVLALPEGYNIHRQIARNTIAKMLGYYGWLLALIGAAVLALIAGLGWFVLRMVRKRPA